jgi:hypothetical protein
MKKDTLVALANETTDPNYGQVCHSIIIMLQLRYSYVILECHPKFYHDVTLAALANERMDPNYGQVCHSVLIMLRQFF